MQLPGGAGVLYTPGGIALYRHPDWLGSVRATSTGASPTSAYSDVAYAPFGEPYSVLSGISYAAFTGQNQDTILGLTDFPFREYSPTQGRWISPDPAGLAAVDPTNPQTWNRYAYVMNQPLSFIDPLGLDSCTGAPPGTPCLVTQANGSGCPGGVFSNGACGPPCPQGIIEFDGYNFCGPPANIAAIEQGIQMQCQYALANPCQNGSGGGGTSAPPLLPVSWWQNFTNPNKQTCKNANILAASEAVSAFGFAATGFFVPVTAPVTGPAALAAGGSAALTKLYVTIACP